MSDAPPRFAPDVLGGAGRHDDRKRGPPRLPHTLTTADRLQQALLGPTAAPTNLLPGKTNQRRVRPRPSRTGAMADTLARLKTSFGAPVSRSARTACWQSRRAWSSTAFSRFFLRLRAGFFVWIVRQSFRDQRSTLTSRRNSSAGRGRDFARADRPADGRKRRKAGIRLYLRACRRLVERERG